MASSSQGFPGLAFPPSNGVIQPGGKETKVERGTESRSAVGSCSTRPRFTLMCAKKIPLMNIKRLVITQNACAGDDDHVAKKDGEGSHNADGAGKDGVRCVNDDARQG
ncbi:hypothetical protein L484_014343 [Morus notabilis]|uniref:Uncharacterized protein n=1 Tax=Morus notabilis TaxID=981085 RepID=W9S9U4_9ROSA|nr:hypothetical protein L484_014343 [Morus notabilis]